MSTSFCTARINRASLPYEVIDQTCRETGISFDQLLYGTPVKQIDGNDLLVIKNGLIKSLLELKGGGFINKADTPDDIENPAKIQAASIEHELNLHWTKKQKRQRLAVFFVLVKLSVNNAATILFFILPQ